MIVVCTGCGAKFKVADEKIGPRGARLRCSKCATIFLVQRDAPPAALDASPAPASASAPEPRPTPPPAPEGVPPRRPSVAATLPGAVPPPVTGDFGPPLDARAAFEVDLEPPSPRRSPEPRSAPEVPAPEDPFASAAAVGSAAPPPDPLAAPPDPFALPAASPDPFAAAPGSADPFAATPGSADPFAAVQAPVPPELLRVPPAQPSLGVADPFAAVQPGGAAGGVSADLTLEEPTGPRSPRPRAPSPADDPFSFDLGEGEPGGLQTGDIPPMPGDLGADPFGAFEAQGEPAPPEPAPMARGDQGTRTELLGGPGSGSTVATGSAGLTGATTVTAPQATAPAGPPVEQRLAPLRTAAVNAVSLLVLLLAALALLVVWRGHVPLAQAFRPSAVMAALRGGQEDGPFVARHVTSGLYERAGGAPLAVVRGEVLSRAPAAVAAVRVEVELLQRGEVVARGAVRAGAVLGPEELHGAADAAALEAALRAAAARAPAEVAPGQAIPFLVALADAPADLSGAVVRVRAAEEAAR